MLDVILSPEKQYKLYVDTGVHEQLYVDVLKQFIKEHFMLLYDAWLYSDSIYYAGEYRRFLDLELSVSNIISLKDRFDAINSLWLEYFLYTWPLLDPNNNMNYITPTNLDTISWMDGQSKNNLIYILARWLSFSLQNPIEDSKKFFLLNWSIKIVSNYIQTDISYDEWKQSKKKRDLTQMAEQIYASQNATNSGNIKDVIMYFVRQKFLTEYYNLDNDSRDAIFTFLNWIYSGNFILNQDWLSDKLKNYKTYSNIVSFAQDICTQELPF